MRFPKKLKKKIKNGTKCNDSKKETKNSSPTTAITISKSNTILGIKSENKKKSQDIFKITYYSYNKKSYFAKDCTKPKS